MKDLIENALNIANLKGADYADIRIVRSFVENIAVKNGIPEVVTFSEDQGFGIRVLYQGAWGFASSSRIEKKEIEEIAELAFRIARASVGIKGEKVILDATAPIVDTYKSGFSLDPFKVSIEEKLGLLTKAESQMRGKKDIKVSKATMSIFKENKIFANTQGSFIEQEILHSGAGISATAVKNNEVQQRSYPNRFRGHFAAAGYEFINSLQLIENAEKTAEEASALLYAKQCPQGKTTLILDGGQMALQVHESIGHPIELDRVLGTEASYAGTSFLTLDKLSNLQYASPIVNVTADATIPIGLGSFGYDDEGVKAQKTDIIKNGKFVGYLTSRETAPGLNQISNGTMRADNWNRIPLIRMTNINLEPGEWDFEELIQDTKDGIYMETNKSWSIDDRRLNFQFGTEIAWEIKNGKLGQIFKNPTYTGITTQFWNSCDAICNKNYWQMWGTPNCGKGEPGQVIHVGHGCAPARFRNVEVGVGQW